jgi:hypothetical protein
MAKTMPMLKALPKAKTKKKAFDCAMCQYRQAIEGNSHIRCVAPKAGKFDDSIAKLVSIFGGTYYPDRAAKAGVKMHPTGINGGWANWPLNFDPVWVVSCASFKKAKKA